MINIKKYEILINNVERVEEKLHIYNKIRNIKMNRLFAIKKVKELSSMIPRKFDVESIKKFEKKTGLKLKYHVYYDKYGYYEFSSLGIWPKNEVKFIDKDGNKFYHVKDFKENYLEFADIIIIDKISKIKEDGELYE